ncbi:MAG: hypothetical protein ABIN18_08815 [Pseudomonadota bacterium]
MMLIIVGAGFLAEFLYFGLLLSKSGSHQAVDTIFILNGASERIKKGYELAAEKEESGNRREEREKWKEEREKRKG